MNVQTKIWIPLLKSTYCLQGNDQEWLDNISEQAKLFVGGVGILDAWTYSATPTTFGLGVGRGPSALNAIRKKIHDRLPSVALDKLYRMQWTVCTASEYLQESAPKQAALFSKVNNVVGHDVLDIFGIRCSVELDSGVIFVVFLPERRRSTVKERKLWTLFASHIGAGFKLRKFAQILAYGENSAPGRDDGRRTQFNRSSHTAGVPLVNVSVEKAFRESVSLGERFRASAASHDSAASIIYWQGLMDGRWSLIDSFECEKRNFIVAIKVDGSYRDPRRLTKHEQRIADYAGMGYAVKEIASVFGVSYSAITNVLTRIQKKLNLSSRLEVVRFFSPSGIRLRLTEVFIEGEPFLVGSISLVYSRDVLHLTESETEVLTEISMGFNNADIANHRGVSEHTIANQVFSIFRKLGVRSRAELVFKLCEGTLHSPMDIEPCGKTDTLSCDPKGYDPKVCGPLSTRRENSQSDRGRRIST
jgi:DNA-binding NarL/FixJ family response regulator